jgi:16S rRNA (uracil1498-N3)-methyltransferase
MDRIGTCAMKRPAARPPRFAIAPDAIDGRIARIGGNELHHLRDVMRLDPGAAVRIMASDGAEFAGRIARFGTDYAEIEIDGIVERKSSNATIILATAIIKGPRMDFLVEKAAELGASALWPLECAHAVVRNPGDERLARWRRLALAAAKQSLSPRQMQIRPSISVADAVREVPKETLAMVCAEGALPLSAMIRRVRPRAMLIACGPEGDFDAAESAAMEAAGFVAVGLGPNRLRSETAALAALSLAVGALDEIERGI